MNSEMEKDILKVLVTEEELQEVRQYIRFLLYKRERQAPR